MRALLITALFILSNQVFANVECETIQGERGQRPKSAMAKEIALKLGVKTCNGKRFKDVVKGLGVKHNISESVSAMSVEEIVKSLKK